ncbi:hypothetical protein [Streptomyces sp. NPDC020917]|uniref:hypothetical protein n=1 Tax=Streptomyces sp. NPDC020917 TaxID=3365102 RepID=UPI00378E76A5
MSDRTQHSRDHRKPDRFEGGVMEREREADELDDNGAQEASAEIGLEAPEADAAEQHTELVQRRDEPVTAGPSDRNGEANPADTAEQRRVVVEDEDDYR